MAHGVWSVVEARAQLSSLLDRVQRDGYQIISRNGEHTAVVVSLRDWMGPKPRALGAWRKRPEGLRCADVELGYLFLSDRLETIVPRSPPPAITLPPVESVEPVAAEAS